MKRGGEEEKEEKGGEEEKQEENSSSKKPKYFTQWLTYHLTVCVIRHGQIRNNYERKQSCIIIKYYHKPNTMQQQQRPNCRQVQTQITISTCCI